MAIALDSSIKLFAYTLAPQIAISDLTTSRAETSPLPIDYLRATGGPDQFVTCQCDEGDEVKVWHAVGGKVSLAETQRVGQLGNFGVVSSKMSKLVLVPGRSPELRIYKAKEAVGKKRELLEKVHYVKVPRNESRAAGISDDGKFLAATDGRAVYGWRLNEAQERMEEVFAVETGKEVKALDALRPVNEDNYHDGFAVVAYSTGKELNVIAFKENAKDYEEIGRESIEAHNNDIKRIKLAVTDRKVVVITTAHDKCIKMWNLPADWLPPCSLLWNP